MIKSFFCLLFLTTVSPLLALIETWQSITPPSINPDTKSPTASFVFTCCKIQWASPCRTIYIDQWPIETLNIMHYLSDQADYRYCVYNLPLGYVITVVDALPTEIARNDDAYNFENMLRYGQSFDFIGTGKPEAKDTQYTGTNSFTLNPKAFGYYKYNPMVGYVELCQDYNGWGRRLVLFPSRYPSGVIFPFRSTSGWWDFNDKTYSIRWKNLDPTIFITFYKSNILSPSFEISGNYLPYDGNINLPDWAGDFGGTISAFQWNYRAPVQMSAVPKTVPASSMKSDKQAIMKTIYATNPVNTTTAVEISIEQDWEKSTEVTVDSSTTTSASYSFEEGFDVGTGEASPVDFKVSFSATQTHSQETTIGHSRTTSTTESLKISESHTVTLTQPGRYQITLYIEVLQVEPTKFTIEVVKDYDFKIPDANFNGHVWSRNETMDVTASGNLLGKSRVVVTQLS